LIRNIIFDLGNVLVNVEYERFRKKIHDSGVKSEVYDNFFMGGNYRLLGYESGEISTEDFITKCINGLGLQMSRSEYAEAFNDMFSEIPEMSNVVRKFHSEGKHRLFLLSNTSPLHFEYISRRFDYIALLSKYGLSYELKSLKPEKAIYEKAIEFLGIIPEESIFIDDLEENCVAAAKFGIKTINYDKFDHFAFLRIFDSMILNS
jgi:glucose-1-phosphatase